MTDDKVTPNYGLNILGDVTKFVTITPRVVRFNGNIGKEYKASVKIVPEEKFPFSIVDVSATRGQNIKYNLEDKRTGEEKAYILNIENQKNDAGAYYDVLVLKTDSPIQPEFKINVMARFNDPQVVQKKKPSSSVKNTGSAPVNTESYNSFVELIQKMQKQKTTGGKTIAAQEQKDPAHAEELKKKFEALIQKAKEEQEKKKHE